MNRYRVFVRAGARKSSWSGSVRYWMLRAVRAVGCLDKLLTVAEVSIVPDRLGVIGTPRRAVQASSVEATNYDQAKVYTVFQCHL